MLKLVKKVSGSSSLALAKVECVAAFQRYYREKAITAENLQRVTSRFAEDEAAKVWNFFSVSRSLINATCARLQTLPQHVFCRSADALHLTCAAEEGFREIYSHDRHVLAAASYFGLNGVDIIP